MKKNDSILTDGSVHLACDSGGDNCYEFHRGSVGDEYKNQNNFDAVYAKESIKKKLSKLFLSNGWDVDNYGADCWNPLGCVINKTDNVLIKPNWVRHKNHSEFGIECLITNSTIIECVLEYVIKARPKKIIVGDAPIQGCDLTELFEVSRLNSLKKRFENVDVPIIWEDFRRTVLDNAEGVWNRNSECRTVNNYYLVDLGKWSLLEPVTGDKPRFRVAMYDPRLLKNTHKLGQHQYLIAREAIDADVIINLPKLKTHAKAGLTGALKNLVGINGSKEYLPHHRAGGSQSGGDCYKGGSILKRLGEYLGDLGNIYSEGRLGYALRTSERMVFSLARRLGQGINRDGSWYGNDTVWRMCLDLNRILIYLNPQGFMSDIPQRKMFSITDAIVCGEGEGPLAPSPRIVNMLTMANNPAIADFFHAHIMGFDWQKIPIVRESFRAFDYPITNVRPQDVIARNNGKIITASEFGAFRLDFVPPHGWQGQCELS